MNATENHEEVGPKYPHISVDIAHLDGDALKLIHATISAMKAKRVPHEAIQEFATEALTSEYNGVFDILHEWVDVKDDPRYDHEGETPDAVKLKADVKLVGKGISRAVEYSQIDPTNIQSITFLRKALETALETIRFDESLVREARVAMKIRKEMLDQNTNRADGTVSP